MPDALDVLVRVGLENDTQSGLAELSQDVNKTANVVKELTSAIEKEGTAQDATAKKVQMSAKEYKAMQTALTAVKKDSTAYVETLKTYGVEIEKAATKSTSLRSQLRGMREELSALEQAGQEGTQRFLDLSVAAGQLQDQIGDTSQRIQVLASDTKYLDAITQGVTAIAGGFAVAQGAAALFGSENEDLQKVLVKVQGAMALLNGVQSIAAALNKDSALSILFFSRAQNTAAVATEATTAAIGAEAVVTEGATVSTNAFTAALLANPAVAVVAALTLIIGALALYNNRAKESTFETEKFIDSLNKLEKTGRDAGLEFLKQEERTDIARAKLAGKTEEEIQKIREKYAQLRLQSLERYRDSLINAGGEQIAAENAVTDAQIELLEEQADAAEKNRKKNSEGNKKAVEDAKKLKEQLSNLQSSISFQPNERELDDITKGFEANTKEVAQLYKDLFTNLGKELAPELQKGLDDAFGLTNTPGDSLQGDLIRQQAQKEADLIAKARKEAASKQKTDNILGVFGDVNTAVQATGDAVNLFISAEQQKTEALIVEQQRRVEAAREGNAEILQAEEERLDKLIAKQEENKAKQEAINAALTISQAALNIAIAIGAAIQASNKSNPIVFIATLLANTAAIVGAITTLRSQEFFEGGYTGAGNPREEAGTVHKGEYVMPKKVVDKYGLKFMEDLHHGTLSVNYGGMLQTQQSVRSSQYDYGRLERKFDALLSAVSDGSNSVSVNGDFVQVESANYYRNKLKIKSSRRF